METHLPRGGHGQSVLFLLGMFCVPTSEFLKPLLWNMSHFRFFTPIIVLKGTSVSINLSLFRQVSISGDSPSNVNTVLRCWGQFLTSQVTLSTLSFVWKAGIPGYRDLGCTPQEGRGEEGPRIEMKVPESDS